MLRLTRSARAAAERPGNRPLGVRIEHRDGTVTPVHLMYRGPDDAGVQVWVATGAVFKAESGDRLKADVMPSQTSILFETSD